MAKLEPKTAEQTRAEIEKLKVKINELIKRRIEIENDMMGKQNSVIYVGNSYAEMLFNALNKNLTKTQKIAYANRASKLKTASKKAYNQYNVKLLQSVKEDTTKARKRCSELKVRLKGLEYRRSIRDSQEIISARELFDKEYEELDNDEKIVYWRVNERANKELLKKNKKTL